MKKYLILLLILIWVFSQTQLFSYSGNIIGDIKCSEINNGNRYSNLSPTIIEKIDLIWDRINEKYKLKDNVYKEKLYNIFIKVLNEHLNKNTYSEVQKEVLLRIWDYFVCKKEWLTTIVNSSILNLTGTAPESIKTTINVEKPSNATIAKIIMKVYDPDQANEGTLSINWKTTITLFGSQWLVWTNNDKVLTVEFNTSADYWNNWNNELIFTHDSTGGYRIESIDVEFSLEVAVTPEPIVESVPNSTPELWDTTCTDVNICRIQIDSNNKWFWKYNNKPVLLVWGSSDDNLFQTTGKTLTDELDLIQSVWGNYIRNTMSDSNEGNLKAFYKRTDWKYDLTKWNDTYWDQFDLLLKEAEARDIIVQIEVWDRFDHSRTPWLIDPYHPDKNINYTNSTSGLADTYPNHPGSNEQPFFYTVPKLDDNKIVRVFQEAFIDKMLSYSLRYKNVLYTMDNETGGNPEWWAYWANYIKSAAIKSRKKIELTEMWDDRDLTASSSHINTWDNPSLYTFTDISQNNHNDGDKHWNNTMFVRNYIDSKPRPMNNVKVYGNNSSHGTTEEWINRFWLSFMWGSASVRFHRPSAWEYGLGILPLAQKQIKAIRKIEDLTKWQDRLPTLSLLSSRSTDEAWLSYKKNEAYVVYFYKSGNVNLNLTDASGDFNLKWLNLDSWEWYGNTYSKTAGSNINLTTPQSNSYGWVAVLTKKIESSSNSSSWNFINWVVSGTQFDVQAWPNNKIHLVSDKYYQLDLKGNIILSENKWDSEQSSLAFPPAIAVWDDWSVNIVTRHNWDKATGHDIRYRHRNSSGVWDSDYIFWNRIDRNYVVGVSWTKDNIIMSSTEATDGVRGNINLWKAWKDSATSLGYLSGIWRADADSRLRAKGDTSYIISWKPDTNGSAYFSWVKTDNIKTDFKNHISIHNEGDWRKGFPDVSIDKYNNAHFIYGAKSEVYYNKYDSSGRKIFQDDKKIFSNLGTWHLDTGLSAIASSEDGNIIVAVAIKSDGTDHIDNGDLFYTYSTDKGVTWSTPKDIWRNTSWWEWRTRPRLVSIDNKFILFYGDTSYSGLTMGILSF